MNEKKVDLLIKRHVKENGGIYLKILPFIVSGLPDRLALLPNATVMFLELKTLGEKARSLQIYWIEQIKKLGFNHVYVVNTNDTLDHVINIIKSCDQKKI